MLDVNFFCLIRLHLLCNGCEESFFNITKISFLLLLIIISVYLVDYIEQFARKRND